jgi:hypothetical protein
MMVFGRGSVPDPDPAKYPGQAEIRDVFDRVHEQVLRELRGLGESELVKPALKPHHQDEAVGAAVVCPARGRPCGPDRATAPST